MTKTRVDRSASPTAAATAPPFPREHRLSSMTGTPTAAVGHGTVFRRRQRRRARSYPGRGQMSLAVHPAGCLVSACPPFPTALWLASRLAGKMVQQSMNQSCFIMSSPYGAALRAAQLRQIVSETVSSASNKREHIFETILCATDECLLHGGGRRLSSQPSVKPIISFNP